MENSKKMKNKVDIKNELISKELTELIKLLIDFIIQAVFFGYVGYKYSIDNNQDIKHGIIFGSLFPLGIALIKILDIGNAFIYIIYTIAYICLIEYVPTFLGFIILFTIIAIFIFCFIRIERKDRTEEISRIYNLNNNVNYTKTNTTITKPREKNNEIYIPIKDNEIEDDIEKDTLYDNEKLEYECEMCFKKISLEEYELNDFMCEECYDDLHTDKYGKFHEDEYFDF